MKSRFFQRLSGLFRPTNTRELRRKSRDSAVQLLEPRQMLTAPTLDTLYDLTVVEDSAERSVALTGITAGGTELQPLRVTATSSNTTLIATPAIDYASPDATGTLRFTPTANRSGNSTITVTVEDGGPDLNLSTPDDNEFATRTFRVTVTPVNDNPTLNALSDRSISEDASQQTVSLSGITAGPLESQPLRVTASSSDTALIPNPTVTYTGPQSTGSIRFTPSADRFGDVTIVVTVEDGGLDSNLNTGADNATFSRSFVVSISSTNDPPAFDALSDVTVAEDAGEQTVNVTGISAGPFETQALVLSATSSNTSLVPDPVVNYTSPDSTATLKFTPTANSSGTALITVVLRDPGQDEDPETAVDNLLVTRTFTITVTPVNDAPTLDLIADVSISEDAGEQVVNLTGISAGLLETQALRVTAVSSAVGIIPDPSVTYTSADATGSLRFTPVANQSGPAVVTVKVEDAGPDGDFDTSADNASFERTFTVNVAAVNDAPTIDDPADLTIDEDASEQTISLTGITAGGGESQALRVTASSSNTILTGTPAVFYTSPNSTGSVKFTPATDLSGTAEITVIVEDPGADGDFSATADNLSTSQTIIITVNPVNDSPTLATITNLLLSRNAAAQTVNLSGIAAGGGEAQQLEVTATSDNTGLIPDPTVTYSSADSTGSISFTPVAGQSGKALITVTVNDAGLDGDLLTTGDNGTVTQTFTVVVNDPPTIDDVVDLAISEDAAEQSVSLSGISGGVGESSQKVRLSATSADTVLIPSVAIDYTEFSTTGTLRFTPSANLSGTSLITISLEDAGPDGDFDTTADNVTATDTFTVTVNAVNDPPTLDDPADLTIDEDAPEQTVNLSGISAGGGESQSLRVTATSNNLALIASVGVSYSSPAAIGTLRFTPEADASGTAVITVVVEDSGFDGDFGTEGDNATVTQTFTVTVSSINDLPTIDAIFDSTISEDASEVQIDLTGITAGGGESQSLRITAVSSDTSLISTVAVDYTSPAAIGALRYQPLPNQSGTTTITVRVEDNGFDGDPDTAADNGVSEIEFTVTVTPVNDTPTLDALTDLTIDEDAAPQTVNLSGISAGGGESQLLKISVSSSDTTVVPVPEVTYVSGNPTGSISVAPALDQFGTSQISVTVRDAGFDGEFDTSDDLTVTRSFVVTVNSVNDAPTITQPEILTFDEDAPEQTLTVTGISAGGGESQPLSVAWAYTNTALFTAFTVVYTSPDGSCDIIFTPAPETVGQSTVTLTVTDGGPDLDLSTIGDNASTEITFVITISAVNDPPTLDPLYELTVGEDSAPRTVDLFGIAAGADETQPLRVTATSSDASIVPHPAVTYLSPNSTGSIQLQPLPNAFGVVEIKVTVTDGGLDGDLDTAEDNAFRSEVFTLTVAPINDPPAITPAADETIDEDSPEQTVMLSGISAGPLESQPLRVTAESDNPGLIPNPVVTYTTPDATGTLKYQPVANQSGVAVITVKVEDGGDDSRLETAGDNAVYSFTFQVTVNAVNDTPTLDEPEPLNIDEDAPEQTVKLNNVSAGGDETQQLSITATSNNLLVVPNPSVVFDDLFRPELQFTPVADQSGSAIITIVVMDAGFDGDLSTNGDNASVTRTFTVTVKAVNDAPTVDQPDNVTIAEDAAKQTVKLTGVTAGGGETQPISITATSSNVLVVPNPSVVFDDLFRPELQFTPAANQSGSAEITVVVTDGGLDGDLSTPDDNASVTVTFTVTVTAVNDVPTLDQPANVTINEDAPEQTVTLTGITAGGGETQLLSVTVTSSFPALVPDPVVTYKSADTSGSLTFTPIPDMSGSALILVEVTDAGLDGDLSTTEDNGFTILTFTVYVDPVNDNPTLDPLNNLNLNEDAATQTVDLTGISAGGGENQPLNITATSSDGTLIANPTVTYSSADAVGSLTFTPAGNLSGSAVITVSVTDGGFDGDLSTAIDNGFFTRTFTVTVKAINDTPTLDQPDPLNIDEDAAQQTVKLTGVSAGGDETQQLSITATSNNLLVVPNPSVVFDDLFHPELQFTPVANASGSAVITIVVMDAGLDGDLSTADDNASVTRTFTVTVKAVNDAPTVDQPDNVTIAEDAAKQTVKLTGVTAGGGETQPISITATSSNLEVVPNPSVVFDDLFHPELQFAPAANQSGSAVITVVVTDGGLDGDLLTPDDNGSVTVTFTVTVNAVNDVPTLDQPANVTINEDAPEQTVTLTGITAGGGEDQPLRITATSGNASVIADPEVVYSSTDSFGSLKFTPIANQSGVVEITVEVTDGGLDGNLSTATDNVFFIRTFTVTVNAVNDSPTLDALSDLPVLEDSGARTVSLTGITAGGDESQPLQITAVSSNAALIPNPIITYNSPDSSGTLQFTPVANSRGTAVITVMVTDGGPDADLSTSGDNLTTTRTFTVTVAPIRPVVTSPTGSVTSQRPVIAWTAVPNAVSYDVWIGNISAGRKPLLQASSVATTFLPTVNLGIGKLEAYVRGVRSDGTKLPWSAAQFFTIITQLTPNPLNPIQTNVRPTVTWPAITGAARYEVDVDDISRNNLNFVRIIVTTTSWTPTEDLGIGLYRFYARALAADNTPAMWSAPLDFTISSAPQPVAPVTATFNRLQEFSWTPVFGATSYQLQLRSESTGQTVANVSGITTTRWTPSTALPDGNYSWVVAGFSSSGNVLGTFSSRVFFNVGGRPTITSPIGSASSTQPVLRWQNVIGAASYEVQLNRRFGGEPDTVVFKVSGITGNSFVPTIPLISGATYRFWVRAVSSTGVVSLWGLPATFTVAALETPDAAPAEIPALLLALPDSPLGIPANRVPRAAVKSAADTKQAALEAAEPVLTAAVAAVPAATRAELSMQSTPAAEPATIDDTISDVVNLLLAGGVLLN